MRILGIDPATKTGWAFVGDREAKDCLFGSFTNQGKTPAQKSSWMDTNIRQLLKENGVPDFAVIEHPILQGPNQNSIVQLQQMFASAKATLRCYGIPVDHPSPGEWRKPMFGFGRRPGWQREDWKRHAKEHCKMLNVPVKNSDQAEAVMIALYGFTTQRYKMMVANGERQGAAPSEDGPVLEGQGGDG